MTTPDQDPPRRRQRRINSVGLGMPPGQNITIDDLATFVDDVRKAGIPGNAQPLATVRFNGHIKTLTCNIEDIADTETGTGR